ncbi:MAG TPA: hypothetical protein VNI60_09210 [Pyrinomonadaceae bacterium]|nr:hypothetical protein [Pyrinomonadaceae bacterium]
MEEDIQTITIFLKHFNGCRFDFDGMDDKRGAATFTVTNTNDSGAGSSPISASLP